MIEQVKGTAEDLFKAVFKQLHIERKHFLAFF